MYGYCSNNFEEAFFFIILKNKFSLCVLFLGTYRFAHRLNAPPQLLFRNGLPTLAKMCFMAGEPADSRLGRVFFARYRYAENTDALLIHRYGVVVSVGGIKVLIIQKHIYIRLLLLLLLLLFELCLAVKPTTIDV